MLSLKKISNYHFKKAKKKKIKIKITLEALAYRTEIQNTIHLHYNGYFRRRKKNKKNLKMKNELSFKNCIRQWNGLQFRPMLPKEIIPKSYRFTIWIVTNCKTAISYIKKINPNIIIIVNVCPNSWKIHWIIFRCRFTVSQRKTVLKLRIYFE